MNFGEALEKVKSGEKIFRHSWNGKGMFVVYQKGYPEGIPCVGKARGKERGMYYCKHVMLI